MNDEPPFAPDFRSERRQSALRMAEHFENTGQLSRAVTELEEALGADPENDELHVRLGFVYSKLDRHQEARARGEAALAIDSENPSAHALVAVASHDLGENRKAEQHHLAALQILPEDPELLRMYGRLMLGVQEHAKAKKLFLASLERDPDDEVTQSLLSVTELQMGKNEVAREYGETALGIAPDEALPHLANAAVAVSTGRVWQARRHAREAIRIDPTNDEAIELFEAIDQQSRWCALPFYYWSLLISRIPGENFGVWAIFVGLLYGLPKLGVPSPIVTTMAIAYILFCLYTWIAMPLTRAWIKLRPARL